MEQRDPTALHMALKLLSEAGVLDDVSTILISQRIDSIQEGVRTDIANTGVLGKSIHSFDFRTRTYTCFDYADCYVGKKIETIGDLIELTPKDLLGIRNLGIVSLEKIRHELFLKTRLTLKDDQSYAEYFTKTWPHLLK
jgi:DNA-directed RNA polymerase alpha subunit